MTAAKNRVQKVLDANIKLAGVATDIFGVSGGEMLQALLEGNAVPEDIAALENYAKRYLN